MNRKYWIFAIVLSQAMVYPTAAAPVPKVADSSKKILGTWRLTKSAGEAPEEPHFVTFAADGTLRLEIKRANNQIIFKGKYKIANHAIDYELMQGTELKSEKLEILKLSETDLRTKDPEGIEEEFEKVKEKPSP